MRREAKCTLWLNAHIHNRIPVPGQADGSKPQFRCECAVVQSAVRSALIDLRVLVQGWAVAGDGGGGNYRPETTPAKKSVPNRLSPCSCREDAEHWSTRASATASASDAYTRSGYPSTTDPSNTTTVAAHDVMGRIITGVMRRRTKTWIGH